MDFKPIFFRKGKFFLLGYPDRYTPGITMQKLMGGMTISSLPIGFGGADDEMKVLGIITESIDCSADGVSAESVLFD